MKKKSFYKKPQFYILIASLLALFIFLGCFTKALLWKKSFNIQDDTEYSVHSTTAQYEYLWQLVPTTTERPTIKPNTLPKEEKTTDYKHSMEKESELTTKKDSTETKTRESQTAKTQETTMNETSTVGETTTKVSTIFSLGPPMPPETTTSR